MSTSLKLAHVPREQRVFLELDLGVGKMSEAGWVPQNESGHGARRVWAFSPAF